MEMWWGKNIWWEKNFGAKKNWGGGEGENEAIYEDLSQEKQDVCTES